jgi:hypothetical protein
MVVNQNRRPRSSVPIHIKRRRQTKKLTRPYTVSKQPVVTAPLAGMATWVRLCCKHSDGSLWNNGIFVNRDHAKQTRHHQQPRSRAGNRLVVPLATTTKTRSDKTAAKCHACTIINKLLQNADTLGIELVIDYAQSRSWRCDRGTWQIGKFDAGDWYHIES